MEKDYIWLALGYSLPVKPSANRVYLWRKLRELGANTRPGTALLPHSRQNLQRLRELKAKVQAMGGEASLAELRFIDEQDNTKLVDWFKKQSEKEYNELLHEMMELCERSEKGSVKAIQKRLDLIRSRDYFEIRHELEADKPLPLSLGAELNFEGGLADLINDIKQGVRDIGSLFAQGGNQPK